MIGVHDRDEAARGAWSAYQRSIISELCAGTDPREWAAVALVAFHHGSEGLDNNAVLGLLERALKAAPNGLEPTSPEARAAIASLVADSYAWFKGMVKDRRKLDGEALDGVADGRVFTGRQAINLKLADEIGREREAIDWLAKTGNVDPKLPVRDWRLTPRFSELSFLHLGSAALLEAIGLGPVVRRLEQLGLLQAAEKLNLDGLLALWHPSPEN